MEFKVGLFVIVSLALMGLLIMKFSKGAGFLTPTYKVKVSAENVGGIIPGSTVLMAGVPIGTISSIDLIDNGKKVALVAKIQSRFPIHKDAIFSIKQAGFLGDRFLSVVPTANKLPLLQDNDEVQCEEPFDLAEVARSTSGLVKRVDQTVQQLNTVVQRIDRTLLTTETLTNLAVTFANFRQVSQKVLSTLDNVDQFVHTNLPSLNGSVSNFNRFSLQLNDVTKELQETLATNRVQFTAAVQNMEVATGHISDLLSEVNQGKGLAGNLLKNEQLSTDVSMMASNLAVLTGNINRQGLWSVIRKPKEPKKPAAK